MKKVLELDPLSLSINQSLRVAYRLAGRYQDALHQLKEALLFDPNFAWTHWSLGETLLLWKDTQKLFLPFKKD
ncbi:MAG: tetratricopeptide repeat protein [Acidobacteriota bacterium]